MINEDISTGLRNALARGQSLQSAVQSMISAGYDPNEVHEATNYLEVGSLGKMAIQNQAKQDPQISSEINQQIKETTEQLRQQIQLSQPVQNPEIAEKPQQTQYQPLPTEQPPKRKIPKVLLILIVVLLILFGLLGGLIFLGDQILNIFFP